MSKRITQEIKGLIEKAVYERDGRKFISLPNSRLDFSKEYIYYGCTEKTVRLAWINGTKEVKVQGRVEITHNDFKLYTEGWHFILNLSRLAERDRNDTVLCPICKTIMKRNKKDAWLYECDNGHIYPKEFCLDENKKPIEFNIAPVGGGA